MSIEYVSEEGVGFICVTDELDLATAGRLREMGELAFRDVGTLRIDMSAVPFIDSTGISALVAIQQRADDERRILILENPSPRVTKVLELTGLTQHFQIK